MMPPLKWYFRLTTALSKVAPCTLYSVKTKPNVISSCNLEISLCDNFTVERSDKTGKTFGGNVGKGVFNGLLCCGSIYWTEQELSKVIGSKRIYVATTYQPKLIGCTRWLTVRPCNDPICSWPGAIDVITWLSESERRAPEVEVTWQ